jgi:DNA polymerase III alpha subunit (gram-positive type)
MSTIKIVSASFGSAYYVLAIDIETSGYSFKQNGIVSIGASLQDQNSNELDFFQINLTLPEGRVYEERCLKEFWSENKKIHDFVQQNAVTPGIAMRKFCTFLTHVETHYPELIVVSDNPSFDIAWINLYLDEYTDRLPLNYSTKKEYRIIWDTYSMQKVLLCQRGDFESSLELPEKLEFRSEWPADHNPLNDARTIADFLNQAVKEMKKNFENKER